MEKQTIELVKEAYYIYKGLGRLQIKTEASFLEIERLLRSCQDANEEQTTNILQKCQNWLIKIESLCIDLKRRKRKVSKIKRIIFLKKIKIQQEQKTQVLALSKGSVSCYHSEHSGRQEIEELNDMIRQLEEWENKYEYMSSRACTKLRDIRKRINELLAKSEQKAQERKEKRLADEMQRKKELEEAKKHTYWVCKINCVTHNIQFKTHRSGNAQRQGAGPPVPTSDKIITI